ncbi:phosphate transporter family-domain-containing protein [Pavlovales sp. CCMP2436]|nr:phosphate transporter family-domain-containing protein [Pavlovales sp. CCMP2436]
MVLRALAEVVAAVAGETACASPIFWVGMLAAVGIGMSNAGNDLSNAMGVTVGAGVLSLRQAVGIGALFDGLGGLLMGSRVTNTIAAGIIKRDLYAGPDGPDLLAKSMLVVMGAGGLTMLTGTMGKVPISAHHSVVGSLVAMALLTRGTEAVEWGLVLEIVFSWVGNPLLGMACSMVSFALIDFAILSHAQPLSAFGRQKWLIYPMSSCTCLPFVLMMSPQLKLPLLPALLLSCTLGLLGARFADSLSEKSEEDGAFAEQDLDDDDDAVSGPLALVRFFLEQRKEKCAWGAVGGGMLASWAQERR